MADDRWNVIWEQLNQRSRWYSSQLWYVPFAYAAIVGFAFDKIANLSYPSNSLGFILLGMFSISVFVHVSALKFYERRAVRSMQEVEGKAISEGGSPWYLSFAWYIRLMICLASYFFIARGVLLIKIWFISVIILLALTILYILIVYKDHVRNRDLLRKIREDTH